MQAPKPGGNIPGFGTEGVTQIFQQLAQSFLPSGAGKILTLCIMMDFPIHINTICMEPPIVYFKGS